MGYRRDQVTGVLHPVPDEEMPMPPEEIGARNTLGCENGGRSPRTTTSPGKVMKISTKIANEPRKCWI